MSAFSLERQGFLGCKNWCTCFSTCSRRGTNQQETARSNCYLVMREVDSGRASGCFDDQSSGGNATRQKVGRGSENSSPISALPPRTQEEQECHVAFLGTVRGGK